MPAYDRTWFDPPAPLARVTLRNPDSGAAVPDVPMLLDSGADVTLVPGHILDLFGLTTIAGARYELVGFDGERRHVAVTRLELLFARRIFRGQFALSDEPWGILGRNLLNVVTVLLDGPNLTWDELRR